MTSAPRTRARVPAGSSSTSVTGVEDDVRTTGILAAAWRYRFLFVGIVALFTLLAAAVGFVTLPPPTAGARIALTNPSSNNVLAPGIVGDASLSRFVAQRADFLDSDEVLGRVSDQLATGVTPEDLRNRITVTTTSTSNQISVLVTGDTARDAVTVAETLADAYRSITQADVQDRTQAVLDSIQEDIDSITSQAAKASPGSPSAQAAATSIATLRNNASEIRTDSAAYGDGVDFVTTSSVDEVSTPSLPLKDIAIGLLLGMVVASVVTWLLADRRREVRDPRRTGDLTGVPMLATVTPARRAGRIARPDDYVGAAVSLRSRVPRGVVVLLDARSRGQSHEVALGLAYGIRLQGIPATVVEADPLTKGADPKGAGLAEVLLSGSDGAPPLSPVAVGESEVPVLLRGHATVDWSVPGVADNLRRSLAGLADSCDFVIVDAGAGGSGPLAPLLTALADCVLLVVEEGALEESVEDLALSAQSLNAPVVGYVYAGSARR